MAKNEDPHLSSVETLAPQARRGAEGREGDSGIYVVERDVTASESAHARARAGAAGLTRARKAMNPLLDHVTLVVYGWKSVEPGTLSWVFPSVGAAVAAARAMKNAVRWAIVAGRRENDGEDENGRNGQDDALDEARANGSVLIEQAG